MSLPSIKDIIYSWRRTLTEKPNPPFNRYIQNNELLNVELVSTSKVQDAPIETFLTGSNTGITTTAAAITSSEECLWVMVQAHPNNTANILIGNSAGQTWVMVPGAVTVIPVDNVAKIIAKSEAGTQILNGLWGY